MEDITVMYHHIPKKARDRASFMFNRKEAERIEKATLGLISSGLTLPNFTKIFKTFQNFGFSYYRTLPQISYTYLHN